MKNISHILRRLKASYVLYNFFHKKELQHNVPLYKQWGLKKKYYSPVSSKDFVNLPGTYSPHAGEVVRLEETRLFKRSDASSRENLRQFVENGYAILPGFYDMETVDRINTEIQNLLASKKVGIQFQNKIMFAIRKSAFLKNLGEAPELLELLSALLQDDALLFQSINFLMGSEQKTHSDSIHMTTYPLGGLLGVWIALEDIDADNGPLHYYPGSHHFPYYLNKAYNNEGNYFLLGKKDYSEYEAMMAAKIRENGLQKKIFTARKGDLIIWHANLFHGGEPHLNKNKTRKSMVFHYYAAHCICYHEISQRPALMPYHT